VGMFLAGGLAPLGGLRSAHAQAAADLLREEVRYVGKQKPPETVVARIGGEPVTAAEVNRLMKQAMRGRRIVEAAMPLLEANTLDQVINRHLITRFLDSKKIEVSDEEVDDAYKRRTESYKKQGSSIFEALAEMDITEKKFRDDLQWQLRWEKAVNSYLTEANFQKYFAAHRKEYDGTEVRVSQILLRPNGTVDEGKLKQLSERATTIRDSIIGELTTFAAAAKKHSEAPSRAKGGDIGFIPRHGLMDEDFAAAAFALEPGQVSEPVLTKYGAHLLQVSEIRPGKKTASDVRKDLEPALRKEAFEKVSKQMRGTIAIEYTGAISYLNPETGELVTGEATEKKDEPSADESKK